MHVLLWDEWSINYTSSVPKEYELLGLAQVLLNKGKSKRERKGSENIVSGEWGLHYYNGISVNSNGIRVNSNGISCK